MRRSEEPGVAGTALRIVLVGGGFALTLLLLIHFGDALAVPFAAAPPAVLRIPGSLAICLLTLGLLFALHRTLGPRDGDVMGLGPLRQAWRPLLAGMLLWTVPAVVSLAAAQAMGLIRLQLGVGWATALALAATHLLAVLLAEALPEELVFRGYIAGLLARRLRML